MEENVINLITQVGLPIALVIYYVFVIMPRQEARYDALIEKILTSQKDCSDKMSAALEKHNTYIDELTTLIEKKFNS